VCRHFTHSSCIDNLSSESFAGAFECVVDGLLCDVEGCCDVAGAVAFGVVGVPDFVFAGCEGGCCVPDGCVGYEVHVSGLFVFDVL
jgi:hypothetical protein